MGPTNNKRQNYTIANKPDIVIKHLKNKKGFITDLAVPNDSPKKILKIYIFFGLTDRNTEYVEYEDTSKYLSSFAHQELLSKNLKSIPGNSNQLITKTLQRTAILLPHTLLEEFF